MADVPIARDEAEIAVDDSEAPEVANKITITKEQIMEIRHLIDKHCPNCKIFPAQRTQLRELFHLQNLSHSSVEIAGMPNGFARGANADSISYITSPEIMLQYVNVRAGDMITYHTAYEGLEGMVIGITEDFSCVAILNLNFDHEKFMIEHYPIQHIFGGYPGADDVRKVSERREDWIDSIPDNNSGEIQSENEEEEREVLVITKEDIMDIRVGMGAEHGPYEPISMRQRAALCELFQLEEGTHTHVQIEGLTNGFNQGASSIYCALSNVCFSDTRVNPGDILTYRVSFDGLEGMVIGSTEDHKQVAILNLNYADARYLVEHYDREYVFGGFPNRQDIRQLSDPFTDWVEKIDHIEDVYDEPDEVPNEDTIFVTKEDIFKVRKMASHFGDIAIEPEQRKALWKLFKMHDYDHTYLKLQNIYDGFFAVHGEQESCYITTPKVCRAFGNHGLEAGDILTYSVSYSGLEGMILGVSRDRSSMAILNLNYAQDQYVLEHYSEQHILGGYPRAGDKRELTSKFIDRGMTNPEVKQYYDQTLLPFLFEFFLENLDWFPNPVIETIANYVAEMTSIEDFALCTDLDVVAESPNDGQEGETSPDTGLHDNRHQLDYSHLRGY